ncbi:MAG: Ppx/GppA family phosphatase [Prevotella sp.]|nr:Ppx/GppA family phosphatase [Prevotella sp.]
MTHEKFNLAAIDIGSNGARFLIKEFSPDAENPDIEPQINKVLFIRVPLRLGIDVFSLGKISKERQYMMIHMMKGCKQFMLVHHVKAYRACATAAMRDAENGKKVIQKIEKETGISLEIINGEEEAKLLCNNLIEETGSANGNVAYIDVGGGSTEVSLIHNGQLVESHSYNIGTLRLLSEKVKPSEVKRFEQNLSRYSETYPNISIIGSGGNINKLNKLCRHSKGDREISVEEVQMLHDELKEMTIEERIEKYRLKTDRADVIVPASEVFLKAAQCLRADSILVPNISLADSIVDGLYNDVVNR